MQLQNSEPYQLDPSNPRRWRILIAVAILFFIIVIVAILILKDSNSKKNEPFVGQYQDPLSHQTVSNPPGKTPDTFGANVGQPLYLGFDKLLDQGITFEQLKLLKLGFYRYSKSQTQPIKEMSIDVDNITSSYNQSDPNAHYFIFFKVRFDRKNDYKAKVEYEGINDIRLYLTDLNSGKQIYDSQVIDSTAGD